MALEDPFSEIDIDMARFNPEEAQMLLIRISNALTAAYQASSANRSRLIALGSAPKKAEGYDALNTERYEVEHKIDSLKTKWNTVSQILYWKANELRHWAKMA